jgi:predicted regulator of Ras-like GTPase activity (Roadblock/LC7/MglB family)
MSTIDDQEVVTQIKKLVGEAIERYVAIKGVSIGTSLATNIFTLLKPEVSSFSESELIASATSFQYIAKNMFDYIVNNQLKATYVTVNDYVLLVLIVKEISAAFILDRKLAELEGIQKYQKELNTLVLKISAFVETSEYLKEDPFVQIKRAVPSATLVAIISKEGMPIKVESVGDLQEAMVGSMVAALSNLTTVMLKTQMEYSILHGVGAHLIVVQFDIDRIIALSIPEEDEGNIGTYLAKIKEIIKLSKGVK